MPEDRRLRWVFLWHDARNFVRRVWEGAEESEVPVLASAIAFDGLVAAIPFGVVVLALVGYILNAHAMASRLELTAYLQNLFPSPGPQAANPFLPVIQLAVDVVRARGRLTLVGLPLFILLATRLFGALRAALCDVFDAQETRSWLRGKLSDAGLVVATGLLFVADMLLSGGVIGPVRQPSFIEYFGTQLLAFVFLVLLFGMIFKFAPARHIRWGTALVAAVTCAVGFAVASEVLIVILRTFIRPDRLVSDGTLGAILFFVGFIYYLAFIFLIAGEIAKVHELGRLKTARRAVLH